jgi:hypothetical protein
MRQLQRELHQQLRAESVATRERIAAMVKGLDLGKLNEHPEPEGWSIGQVAEHLCHTDELYDEPVATLLGRARPDAGAPTREWKPSFIGGLIAKSLLRPRRLKAPKVFRPALTPRQGVVDQLLARELGFAKAMDDAASYDWRALRIASPALPGWAPKMNLGDSFRIHVIHVSRHAKQIERLVTQLG